MWAIFHGKSGEFTWQEALSELLWQGDSLIAQVICMNEYWFNDNKNQLPQKLANDFVHGVFLKNPCDT